MLCISLMKIHAGLYNVFHSKTKTQEDSMKNKVTLKKYSFTAVYISCCLFQVVVKIHAQTHTYTHSPQTLYNSALGFHHRQCRQSTPPSPGPSVQFQRSVKRTDLFSDAH